MARELEALTNVDAPDGDNEYGKLRDNDGTGNGTPVNEALLGDQAIFFARLMAMAGITPNGQRDNSYSGYQLFEAFQVMANNYNCTSTTSIGMAAGLHTFTVREGMSWKYLNPVTAFQTSNTANFMIGLVTSYSGTSLQILAVTIGGSGTITDWTITLSGQVAATESRKGISNLVSQANMNTGTDDVEIVTAKKVRDTPSLVTVDGSTKYHQKVVSIGDWDMDATATINVAHGITLTKFRSASFTIRNDSNDTYYPDGRSSGGVIAAEMLTVDATNVVLRRVASGIFDSTDFDSTSYNRGWVTIFYEE